ncbi:Beta-mannanase/endoglucanase A precursor [Bordetella ansorpii]|uniref:Beta-mannanase/endoglucanase A n=1 Tax=Bordetella ansorpii TaxID=288768 RepID=A0A157SA68_9BORD|nr:glycoside hydrolase family 44 protein [Bordetella ansorpii]SAI66796.1 Beta-mannanase/endoglucanase A precursor [Bordetella ansorpii]
MPSLGRFILWFLLAAALLLGGIIVARGMATDRSPLPAVVSIDAAANRRPISPLVYGMNFATTQMLRDLRIPINRSGGNSASAYNWRLDARNAGKDWFFESLAADPAAINDQFGERFVALTRDGGAIPMVTISMIGRVAKLGQDRTALASFSMAKYGRQLAYDVDGLRDAGNGVLPDGTLIVDNDPNDATVPNDPRNEQARVEQLVQRFGPAGPGAPRYYVMDNEPSLWHLIHRDIHPVGAHASEVAEKVLAYSRAVKTADPGGLVVAPEEWGWFGYHYSGFDQQYSAQNGLDGAPDRKNETGGMDYVPWLLSQWKAAGRPIDVFSLHFYPQGGEYSEAGAADTPEIALARNRSTRNLWDPAYKDPTWINSVVSLIPRMRQWVDSYYHPGTPIALTEYNWGGDAIMNGATAQADLLGIFGREGLDIATRWGAPDAATPVYKAFKLYRNYDGQGSGFGSTSVAAVTADPDQVSSFAALRDEGRTLTVVVINKQLDRMAAATLKIGNFAADGQAETWQLANNALVRLPDAPYAGSQMEAVLPPQSVTLFVLRGAAPK